MELDPPPLDLHMNSNDDDDEEIEHQIGTFDTPSSSLFSPPPTPRSTCSHNYL